MQKEAEDPFSDAFFGGFEKSDYRAWQRIILRRRSRAFRIGNKGILDDIPKNIIQRWKQLFSSTYFLTKRALSSPRFERPDANFIRSDFKVDVEPTEQNR